MPYSNEQKADMVLALGAAGGKKKKAVKIFQRWHPGTRPHPSTIVRQYEALKQYGRFIKERCRPAELSDDVRINILAFLEAYTEASLREASRQTDVPLSTVFRVVKEAGLHPYNIQLHQRLEQKDFESRLNYASWLLQIVDENPQFLRNVIWTGEANFLHNAHYWSATYPHWLGRTRHQYKWSLYVWCGICDGALIGPVFLDGTLTAVRYLNEILLGPVEEFCANVPLARLGKLWFQHDGAPAHSSSQARAYLDRAFPSRWIGRYGPVSWPARSPDLTPLDFFL
uniref:Putative transposable element n=1 Tax=Ornithodoros turicata TaxID=34597 RepID=A0A2R5LFM4_9ACAR